MSCCRRLGPRAALETECGSSHLPEVIFAAVAAGAAAAPNKSDSSTLQVQGPCPPSPVAAEGLERLEWVMFAANFPK